MSLKSRFLTLSMKEQIYITIILLTFFCILVVLTICCSLSYEFLKADYKKKELYFFNKYKEYLESYYYFQNFYLLQYEELVKRVQKQAWKFHQSLQIYTNPTIFDDYSEAVLDYYEERDKNIMVGKTNMNYSKLFLLCYIYQNNKATNEHICNSLHSKTLDAYQSLSNSLFPGDIYDYLRIPGYNLPLIDRPLFTNVDYCTIFSFNASKIYQKILEIQNGDTSNINLNHKLDSYFRAKVEDFKSIAFSLFDAYIFENLNAFLQMFNDTYNEINNDLNKQINFSDKEQVREISSKTIAHFSQIDYGNNVFTLISYGLSNELYYCETNLVSDYLYFINRRISLYLDSIFIPLYFGNNTLISPELCILFLLKQSEFQIDNETLNDLINVIKKGNSTFQSCFINQNLINSENDVGINDIFNVNYTLFLKLNNLFYKGIMYLTSKGDKYPFYFMKYYYPNYNTLKDFQSEYMIINQVNFYFYSSFKEPIEYSNHILQIAENTFYFIILIILYTWIICLIANLIIYSKVINDWTEPIIKLQEAVESSSIADENIFKYKNDDIINELFVTCKELLSGQIENKDEVGLKNFNILSIPKDKRKLIDKNIYNKNLIINNDIMNNLLNQQQNTMDFSKNIELNEPKNIKIKNAKKKNLNKSSRYSSRLSENNLISSKDDNILDKSIKNYTIKDNTIKDKSLEEKENEPYIKLFKISEYINYHRNKLGPNNILVISNNSIGNESKMSKIISKNSKSLNNSTSNITNLKNSFIRANSKDNNENNGNLFVNMYDEDDISYLWYMEQKKKNNKSFNYNIGMKYAELFTEFNDSYKYNIEMKSKKK